MKTVKSPSLFKFRFVHWLTIALLILQAAAGGRVQSAPAPVLFEDDFNTGIPGWTAVQPAAGIWIASSGPLLWQYDAVTKSFVEQSNLYTDSSLYSGTRIAAMLINDTVAPADFTYTARLTTGDNDGFGLIWGYEDEDSFYRVTFANQNRAAAGWPFQGVTVDRMNNGVFTDLYGPDFTTIPGLPAAGVSFDVTITVSGGQLFLSITNDPLGTPASYNLISGLALPTAPSAKVGMFSWGMQGGVPRGFQIQNPVLTPTPLTGDPANTVLANWSFLVTPRGDGTTNLPNGGPLPMWSQALGSNGDMGAMIENSDHYAQTLDNTGTTANTNFAAPSAVAGDVNWSNYVYSARFSSPDNDGFGMLLRYQNPSNWFRIAFRNQNSTAGVRRGISIQKNVNLVFDMFLTTTAFIPPLITPFDVHAAVRTNELQVLVVSNPDSGTPLYQSFGPFDMASGVTSAVPDKGKIGVFSWAQFADSALNIYDYGTAVDWVKVREVAGAGLMVSSAYGTPDPPVGLNDFPLNSVVTLTNDALILSAGTRFSCVGWTGIGSVPATGSTNVVTVTLTNLSVVNWLWLPQYLLTTNTTPGGTVTVNAGNPIANANLPWVTATSNITVTATTNAGYLFAGWSGDSVSASTNLTFPMLRPMTLTANFTPDSDFDGMADSWEVLHFGNLLQDADGDPDIDGRSNLAEYQLGSNPNFVETLLVSDGLSSQWTNVQRDVALPSQLRVLDFGSGYRGAWEDSNDNRSGDDFTFIAASQYGDYASFQGPRIVVKTNVWNDDWSTNFSYSAELSVGDNDASCFYFRYRNESNWFRVTLCGEISAGGVARPFADSANAGGLSVQRRLNGVYSNLPITIVSGPYFAAFPDFTDGAGTPAGYKKLRVTINGTNQNFEVRVIGWNYTIPDFDPAAELVTTFSDASHPTGRIGFGPWGQGGAANNANQANGIPIPYGAFFDNFVVKSPADGATVFSENWESVSLYTNLPAGWVNPYAGSGNFEGDWRVSAHGTIAQQSNEGGNTTGTATVPRANANANVLIAPDQLKQNYLLQIGFHPFDNDGIGFVYDFVDTNNYSRVMFRQEATFAGDIPPGMSVSRKAGGVWSDVVAGDPAYVYTPGRPFGIEFANNNGDYRLQARDLDNPANVTSWHWTALPAAPNNRFGVTTWAETDAHFLYARAYSLTNLVAPQPFAITNITVAGGNVTLSINKPALAGYHVLRATSVTGVYSAVALNQTGPQYTEAWIPTGTYYYRLQYAP